MARARNIKPGLFKNEDLAERTVWARYLFAGLWTIADREGRLEDRPKRIKAELLPFDTQDVEPLLRELDGAFILRYEVNGVRYIQILNFKRHQTPHYSEKPSVIPPPPLQENEPHMGGGNSGSSGGTNTDKPQEHSGSGDGIKRGSQPPDSPIHRLSDSPTPDSPTPDTGKTPTAGPPADTANTEPYPPDFETAWGAYPKRMGDNPKRRAFHAWRARVREGVAPTAIADGVRRYAAYVRELGKEHSEFVKQAATFFGPDRPFLEAWRARAGGSGRNDAAIAEAERRLFGAERDVTDEPG